jgi:hypothetical protein
LAALRLAAGRGKDWGPVVCLVSKWEERRSKEALAIALGVAARRASIVSAATVARLFELRERLFVE